MTTSNPYEVTAWGAPQAPYRDLELPSGHKCQVRDLKMEDILALGIVNDLDDFGANLLPKQPNRTTRRKQTEAQKKAAEEAEIKHIMGAMSDDSRFGQIRGVLDKVVVATVIQPALHHVPEEGQEREPGKVYVDYVDFLDKLTIFTDVFKGMGEMADFREG